MISTDTLEFKLHDGTIVRYKRAEGYYSIRLKLDDNLRKKSMLQTGKHEGYLYNVEIPTINYSFNIFKTQFGEWLRNWIDGEPPHLEEIKAKIIEQENNS